MHGDAIPILGGTVTARKPLRMASHWDRRCLVLGSPARSRSSGGAGSTSALVALLTSQELWGAVIIFLLVAFVIIKMAVRDYKGIRGECDPGVISKHDHCIHNASSFSEHMQREGIREEGQRKGRSQGGGI